MNNNSFTVCGIVEIDGKILLVRHTYGTAKDRILLPGGYVHEGEMPAHALEREILEETGVTALCGDIVSVQFKPEQWCVVFLMRYVSGETRSDGFENSEVLLLAPEDAIHRGDITNMSRTILSDYCRGEFPRLGRCGYTAPGAVPENYALYGLG